MQKYIQVSERLSCISAFWIISNYLNSRSKWNLNSSMDNIYNIY